MRLNWRSVAVILRGEAECNYHLTSARNPQNHARRGVLFIHLHASLTNGRAITLFPCVILHSLLKTDCNCVE